MSSTPTLDPVTGQPTTVRPCCANKTAAAKSSAFPVHTLTLVAVGASLAAVAYHAYRYCTTASSSASSTASSSCCATKAKPAATASCCGGAAAVEEEEAVSHPYPVLTIEDEHQFDAILANVEANLDQSRKLFVLIEGSKDAATGKSWCPDCVQAAPVIQQALEEKKDSVMLVEAPVRRDNYKGYAQHPYRVHAELKLTSVPTLFRWEKGHVTGQLVEGELFDIDRVRDFIAQ